MSGPHDCVKQIDALLLEKNTRLERVLSFSDPARELILVTTAKVDEKKRGKPCLFFASYCPFCGVKLNAATPTQTVPAAEPGEPT